MAKYVPDIKTQRWVVIAPTRNARPADSAPVKPFGSTPFDKPQGKQGKPICPFCVGNEAITPPEVYRIGSGEKDKEGWQVRVVPNLYPITDIHEVIIHSTDDEKNIEDLPLDQVSRIVTSYRDRYRAHQNDGHVMIFCNHGFHAGASLRHPHSQLVVVPKQIKLDSLVREPVNNMVEENTYFITYCPDFSQWPYEVWIAPKDLGTRFSDLADAQIPDLAQVLQKALQKIEAIYNDPVSQPIHHDIPFGYNYYIYHGQDWYIRIIPRMIHRAGFELGTGLNVNVVDPTEASEQLKKVS